MKVNNVIYQGYSFNHESAFGVMAAWDSYAYRDQIAPFEYEAGNLYATTPTVDPDKKRLQRYDYAGNLKEVMAGYLGDDTARQFAYDQHNRLVWQGRSLGSNSWYLYDALGRRIQKTVGDQTTRYVYSGNRVVEEQDMAGHTIAAYAYGRGLDEPVVMQRDVRNASGAFTPDGVMETYYFHTDAQGNITYLTDEAGELVEAYSYAQETDPWLRLSASQTVPFHNDFGLPTFHDPQTGAAKTIQFTDSGIPSFTDGAPMQSRFGNPFLYNGREWDPELGFYYYRARYLDPLDGRFTTPDPLGPWGDSGNFGNPYTYTGNNPWSRTDPYGLWGLEGLHEVIGNVFYAMVPSLFNWRLRFSNPGTVPDHVPVTTIEEDELAGEYGRSMPVTSNSTYAYETGHQFGEIFNDTLNDTRNAAMIGGSMIPVVGPVLEGVNAIVDSSQGNYYQAATNIAIAGIASRLGGKKPCPGQYRSFTANNFRENLIRLTGTNPGSATHAHHVFPIKLQRIFNRPEINININEPIYGAWWGQGSHLGKVTEYNNEWEVFFENTRSRDEVINFARKLSRDYGFKLYF